MQLLDLTGQVFGDRLVLKKVSERGSACWLVRCKCGREDVVPSQRLRLGGGGSCRKCGRAKFDRTIDLIGQHFGKWMVVGRAPARKGRTSARWAVVCECGHRGEVTGAELRSGHSTSCKSCGHAKDVPPVDLRDPDWCWLLGMFHGDGFVDPKIGVVFFAAKPVEHQDAILHALVKVGVEGRRKIGLGVTVYSVRFARDMGRFKVSGLNQEAWMFPDKVGHPAEWLAGLVDADGNVDKNGWGLHITQKPHVGDEHIEVVLRELWIPFATHKHPTRNIKSYDVAKYGTWMLSSLLRLRYPKKAARLRQIALLTPAEISDLQRLYRRSVRGNLTRRLRRTQQDHLQRPAL